MVFTAWVCDESDSIQMACIVRRGESGLRQRVGQAKSSQTEPRRGKPSQASTGNFSSALHMRRQRGGKRRTHPQAAQLKSTIKRKNHCSQSEPRADAIFAFFKYFTTACPQIILCASALGVLLANKHLVS